MPTLPTSGQTGWDTPLDAYLTALNTSETATQTSLTNHIANSPADPHGDRAYAQSLVGPLTTGVNQPNGFVQLNSSGRVPAALVTGSGGPGGIYTGVIDAVAQYGAFTGSNDTSAKIQNALNAAAAGGGGIVYLGPGTYSLANYLVIGNNTWFMMNQGTKLQRIQGGTTPAYLISNVQWGTSNTPSTQFRISGGTLDAIGSQNLTSNCTPIMLVQAQGSVVDDIAISNVFNNPAIELNGCSFTVCQNIELEGAGSNSTQATVPAIRLNSTSSSTTPTGLAGGLYNNAVCADISLLNCSTVTSARTFMNYGELAGSDKFAAGHPHNVISLVSCSTNNASNNSFPFDSSHWTTFSTTGCMFFESYWPSEQVDSVNTANAGSGWSGTLFYIMLPNGRVELTGQLTAPSSSVNNNTIVTLPAKYRPVFSGVQFGVAATATNSGTTSTMTLGTDGTIKSNGVFASATVWVGPIQIPIAL